MSSKEEARAAIAASFKTAEVEVAPGVMIAVREMSQKAVGELDAQNLKEVNGKTVPNPDGLNMERLIAAATGFTMDEIAAWPKTLAERVWEAARKINGSVPEPVAAEAKK